MATFFEAIVLKSIDATARLFGVSRARAGRILFGMSFGLFLLGGAILLGIVVTKAHQQNAFAQMKARLDELGPNAALGVAFGVALLTIAIAIRNTIVGIQKQSRDYARKVLPRRLGREGLSVSAKFAGISLWASTGSGRLRRRIKALRDENEVLRRGPEVVDVSTPEKVFQISRQRLLDDAVRLDSIAGRNLVLGILFSTVALAVLAWPLLAAAFQDTRQFDVIVWAAQYYLPRFAVGLLLQFVGFFFLRLYVANEQDVKHNKNELTNLELKMVGVQLAQTFDDAASKKEIMKSLSTTERNFVIKKGERTISTEAASEYNDMKQILEKVINKLPGGQK